MKSNSSARINIVLVAILSLIGIGTFSVLTSCRHLNPVGPYKGDIFLWTSDTIIIDSYFIIDNFLKWEQANRENLKGVSGIKQFADKLREEYPKLHQDALTLRDIYAQVPTQESRNNLIRALDSIHQLILEISKYQTLNTIQK